MQPNDRRLSTAALVVILIGTGAVLTGLSLVSRRGKHEISARVKREYAERGEPYMHGARRRRRGRMGFGVATSFIEAKEEAASINAEVDSAGAVLKRFPKNSRGLTSEEVRLSPEYRAAKTTFDRAFAKLRNFNEIYVKRFAKELRAERSRRYTGRATT